MFIAEAAPIHRLDVFLVIYKLITGGCRTARTPPATAIIVWPRPDRAICSSRRAAPLPPRSCLGVVPNAHPSSLLCCTNKGQEDTRKRAQSLTRVPASNQKARTPRGPQKKRSLVNKKPTPGPYPPLLITVSLFFLHVSKLSWYALPFQHPSAVITPPGETRSFF